MTLALRTVPDYNDHHVRGAQWPQRPDEQQAAKLACPVAIASDKTGCSGESTELMGRRATRRRHLVGLW